jgi:hypothetical protein
MPLAAFHLFPCVIAAHTCDLSRFDTLALQASGTGLRMTSFRLTQLCSQGIIDEPPESTASPGVILVGNRPIRREIAGQIPPGAPVAITTRKWR